MKVQIVRIEDYVVNCCLSDGQLLDIDRRWLPREIEVDDEVDFDVAVALA